MTKKMRLKILPILVVVLIFSSIPVALTTPTHVRVIAHTDQEVAEALARGCVVVRETRTLTALLCPPDVASALGLQEDIRVYAMDTGANAQINADDVHVTGNTGAGRIIAVLDTGVDYTHSQLSDSILKGWDFVQDDSDPMDLNGHGTHVAGIITANGGRARGVAPDASVLAVRVLDASGSGYFSDIIAAIYWVVDNSTDRADGISMSLGTGYPYLYKGFCDTVLPDMTNAIKYARNKNVIVVVAAGNSGSSGVSIPGCISWSTTVGAVDSTDKIASFSGRGGGVDLTAPGVSIYSTWLGNTYKTASGTSMATPMVSGTVALIKVAHPTYTPGQIEAALFSTAKDLGATGWDSSYGYGRVDALGAVNYGKSSSSDFSLSTSPSSLTIQQGGSGSSNITVTSLNGFNAAVTLSLSENPAGVTASFSPNTVTPPSGGSATSTLTINVNSSTTTGSYTLNVTGVSDSLTHTTTLTLTVTTPPTTTLSVNVTTDKPTYTRNSFAFITVTVSANGATVSGASVTLTVKDPNGGTAQGSGTTNGNGLVTFKYRIGPKAPLGEYIATAQASATGFNSGIGSTTFTVSV